MGESQVGDETWSEPTRPSDHERVSLARTFGGRSPLREVLETVLLTVMLFLVINTFTGRSQVNGSSMEPTLHNGQYLIISKVSYWIHSPERGDIIVLHPPSNVGEDYIKRVVGLPGERIEVRDGKVWVDGVVLDEPYISTSLGYSESWDLGEGEYVVLGDNRNNSDDSHKWGPLAEEDIVGKAWLCYWPPEQWGLVEHHDFSEIEE
ncbi:MAG: signal peptidase I [Anaerolineae bacterium]